MADFLFGKHPPRILIQNPGVHERRFATEDLNYAAKRKDTPLSDGAEGRSPTCVKIRIPTKAGHRDGTSCSGNQMSTLLIFDFDSHL